MNQSVRMKAVLELFYYRMPTLCDGQVWGELEYWIPLTRDKMNSIKKISQIPSGFKYLNLQHYNK